MVWIDDTYKSDTELDENNNNHHNYIQSSDDDSSSSLSSPSSDTSSTSNSRSNTITSAITNSSSDEDTSTSSSDSHSEPESKQKLKTQQNIPKICIGNIADHHKDKDKDTCTSNNLGIVDHQRYKHLGSLNSAEFQMDELDKQMMALLMKDRDSAPVYAHAHLDLNNLPSMGSNTSNHCKVTHSKMLQLIQGISTDNPEQVSLNVNGKESNYNSCYKKQKRKYGQKQCFGNKSFQPNTCTNSTCDKYQNEKISIEG